LSLPRQPIATSSRPWWSAAQFGDAAADRYEALIGQALIDLGDDPFRPGARQRDELSAGIYTYHLAASRANSPYITDVPSMAGLPHLDLPASLLLCCDGLDHRLARAKVPLIPETRVAKGQLRRTMPGKKHVPDQGRWSQLKITRSIP